MEDKNIEKTPEGSPAEEKRGGETLPDEALETAAGGCKPMPKYPPQGIA